MAKRVTFGHAGQSTFKASVQNAFLAMKAPHKFIEEEAMRQFSISGLMLMVAVGTALTGCAVTSNKEVVVTSAAPAALGPYSQAIKSGNTLYLSGQIPLDPTTNQINVGSIEDQTKQVMENLKAVLAANSMTMDDVVSTTVYLKDINDFPKMNAAYGSYFNQKPPARATIQAGRLPKDVGVEISAIATK